MRIRWKVGCVSLSDEVETGHRLRRHPGDPRGRLREPDAVPFGGSVSECGGLPEPHDVGQRRGQWSSCERSAGSLGLGRSPDRVVGLDRRPGHGRVPFDRRHGRFVAPRFRYEQGPVRLPVLVAGRLTDRRGAFRRDEYGGRGVRRD